MKITIGGCRDYNDYNEFKKFVDDYIKQLNTDEIIIISGHCSGVDMMAERYAEEKGLKTEIFPADWKRYGKAAGPVRNKTMVDNCDRVIAFWDNKSRGTASLIKYAEKMGKEIVIKII